MKIAVIGCGLRTPLLIHGLFHANLGISRISLYDTNRDRSELMAVLGRAIVASGHPGNLGCGYLAGGDRGFIFVLSSIRVGGMKALCPGRAPGS